MFGYTIDRNYFPGPFLLQVCHVSYGIGGRFVMFGYAIDGNYFPALWLQTGYATDMKVRPGMLAPNFVMTGYAIDGKVLPGTLAPNFVMTGYYTEGELIVSVHLLTEISCKSHAKCVGNN